MGIHGETLLAPRPTPNLKDHPSSAVRDCLFNLFAATLHIGGRSSIRNLRTRHAMVTGSHIRDTIIAETYLDTLANFIFPIVYKLSKYQELNFTQNTGLFISPSGISDPCGTVAGMVTPKGSMSKEGETLQVSVLPYRCSIC